MPSIEKLKGTWDMQFMKNYQIPLNGDTVFTHNTMYQPGGRTITFTSNSSYTITNNLDGGPITETGTYELQDWALTNDIHQSIFWNATSQYGAEFEWTEVKYIDENILILINASATSGFKLVSEISYIRIKN